MQENVEQSSVKVLNPDTAERKSKELTFLAATFFFFISVAVNLFFPYNRIPYFSSAVPALVDVLLTSAGVVSAAFLIGFSTKYSRSFGVSLIILQLMFGFYCLITIFFRTSSIQ